MRRSGLLTAVFALAVGITVAFGASAAQPQPRAHVYLLRGLLNIFSLGMDSLAEELKRRDVDATVHSYGEWQTLADQAAADYKARKEAPIILIGHSLGADAVIQVRYVDTNGELQGPFPIKFDPEAALIRDQRKILDMTATSWLSFREFNGLLVYYTHLVSYRCAIREVRVGIDTAVPDKVLKMPPCDIRDPSVIPHDAQLYLKLAPSTQTVSVELTYRDGSVSEIKSFRR